jgi:hypothetical protein
MPGTHENSIDREKGDESYRSNKRVSLATDSLQNNTVEIVQESKDDIEAHNTSMIIR